MDKRAVWREKEDSGLVEAVLNVSGKKGRDVRCANVFNAFFHVIECC